MERRNFQVDGVDAGGRTVRILVIVIKSPRVVDSFLPRRDSPPPLSAVLQNADHGYYQQRATHASIKM
jgi:hypothetical protein